MPEGLEVEIYRRAAEAVVGRTVASAEVDERQAQASEIRSALPGCSVVGVDRVGKLLLIDFDRWQLGIHFGMAGRLIVDGFAPIETLAYSSSQDRPDWDRLVLTFDPSDGAAGTLRVNDPRRWSRFTLNPEVDSLGTDLFDLDPQRLYALLGRRTAPLKTVLLDQSVVAGLGNMLVDELLFQAGIDPSRPARSLSLDEVERLVATARSHLPEMLASGGSDAGLLHPGIRKSLGPCPHPDCRGGQLQRQVFGGRTTVSCRKHQRFDR